MQPDFALIRWRFLLAGFVVLFFVIGAINHLIGFFHG